MVTTCNYNTIANLHTLKIIRAHAKPPAFTSRYLATALNDGDASSSVLTKFLFGEYPTTELFLRLTNSQAGGHLAPTS
jgi:hypothetical protein